MAFSFVSLLLMDAELVLLHTGQGTEMSLEGYLLGLLAHVLGVAGVAVLTVGGLRVLETFPPCPKKRLDRSRCRFPLK